MKDPSLDPDALTPVSRLNAVATIFAKVILRMHERQLLPPKESAETGDDRLDVPPETVLSGGVG
ncbi:MAG: hypothetical protein NXI22_23485 [bacterium]|nr:hypothetical protein [bacterium]